MTRRDLTADQGAATVEFALVLVLLVTILMGIIQFGLAFNAKLTLQHAAREGARVFALTKDEAQAKARAREAALPSVELDEASDIATGRVVVADSGDQIFTQSSTCTTGEPSAVRITRSYTISIPAFTTAVQLDATGVMRCGG